MQWKLEKAEVWVSFVQIVWTRTIDGNKQRLSLNVEDDGTMSAVATGYTLENDERVYCLEDIIPRYIRNQSQINDLWLDTCCHGKTLKGYHHV